MFIKVYDIENIFQYINLMNVTRLEPTEDGTTFYFTNGNLLRTQEPFEYIESILRGEVDTYNITGYIS